jgi:hypothetical protein
MEIIKLKNRQKKMQKGEQTRDMWDTINQTNLPVGPLGEQKERGIEHWEN